MQYEIQKQIIEIIKTYAGSEERAQDRLGAWAITMLSDEQGEWLLEFAKMRAKEEGVA